MSVEAMPYPTYLCICRCRCATFNTLLKCLIIQQLICSFLILVLSCIYYIHVNDDNYIGDCQYEFVFWSGLLQRISGVLGLFFIWRSSWNQCMPITYFVFVIVYGCFESYPFYCAIHLATIDDGKDYSITLCIIHAFNCLSCIGALVFILCKWYCVPSVNEDGPLNTPVISQTELQPEYNPIYA